MRDDPPRARRQGRRPGAGRGALRPISVWRDGSTHRRARCHAAGLSRASPSPCRTGLRSRCAGARAPAADPPVQRARRRRPRRARATAPTRPRRGCAAPRPCAAGAPAGLAGRRADSGARAYVAARARGSPTCANRSCESNARRPGSHEALKALFGQGSRAEAPIAGRVGRRGARLGVGPDRPSRGA